MKSTIISYLLWTIAVILIGINFWHIASLPRHNDALMYTDVARDFHIYKEIDQKKLILIGARSSVGGLYHGPLWQYITYPGYLIGQGNPVIMWWWWMLLLVIAISLSIYIAYKIFGRDTALLYGIFSSIAFTAFSSYLINPHGVLLVLPFFIYTIYRFYETTSFKYLVVHLITGALIFQFQLAIGIPFIVLSTLVISYLLIRRKKFIFFAAFAIVPIMLSNFLLFEIRHNFNLTKIAVEYANPQSNAGITSFSQLLQDRFMYFRNMQIAVTMDNDYIQWIFVFTVILFALQIRYSSQRNFYVLLAYYYVGYFLLSATSKWNMVDHQFYPLLGLTTLVFSSFITLKLKYVRIFFIIVCITIIQRHYSALPAKEAQLISGIGKDPRSWQFLSQVAGDVISAKVQDAGYFIYAPDAYGYAPRYAMSYHFERNKTGAQEFVKKRTTFIIAEAPPSDKPQMSHDWWKKEKLGIIKTPTEVKSYPNGYTWEKVELTEEEQSQPYSHDINLGLHFR